MLTAMSDTATAERDPASGRFVTGSNGGPGRAKGSRNRHSEFFLAAFADDFEKHGPAVIAQVREEQPATYLRIAADLLPREATLDVDVSIWTSATNVLEAYRLAAAVLGTDPTVGLKRLRKIAPNLDIYDVGG
jgi:hypothetical protein